MKKDVELIEAIKNNDFERVKFLISNGAHVNIKNRYGNTPLNTASGFGYFEIVKYLIDKGADIDNENRDGDTALVYASENGHFDVVKYLLEKGSDVIKHSNSLWYASKNCYIKIVKLLIDSGVDINKEYGYDKRYTVLSYALKEGNTEIAELLKANGAK